MMNALKKVAAAGFAVAAVVTMSACGSSINEEGSRSSIHAYAVTFPDGSKVDCLLLNGVQAAGLECAWNTDSISPDSHDSLVGSFEMLAGNKVRCVSFDGMEEEGALKCEVK